MLGCISMSESINVLLMFITAVVAASGFIAVVNEVITSAEQFSLLKSKEAGDRLGGKIEVVHVTANAQVFIYVQNIGYEEFPVNDTRAIIDGEWVDIYSMQLLNSNGDAIWNPSEILKLSINKNLSYGWHTCKIMIKDISSPLYSFKKV